MEDGCPCNVDWPVGHEYWEKLVCLKHIRQMFEIRHTYVDAALKYNNCD